MTDYRLVSEPQADLDIEAAFQWYEKEQSGLGVEFLDEVRAAYNRLLRTLLSISISDQESAEHCSDAFPTRFTSLLRRRQSLCLRYSMRVGTPLSGSGAGANLPRQSNRLTATAELKC